MIRTYLSKDDAHILLQALALATALSLVFMFGAQAYACAPCGVTLSINVQPSLTFSTTNQGFANSATNLTPATPLMATTTLSLTTNDLNGWFVTLFGTNKVTGHNNLQTAGDAAEITDQTEWINGAATSSVGNAVQISSLVNGGAVLSFRVMTASSTNGTFFYAPTWWGTADNYAATNAATLYAGISSTTVQRQIGNAGVGSYSASAHLNDVQYYLNVGLSQTSGSYTAAITYTATGN